MATYRIVCVKTEHPHRHIVSVGTGTDPKAPTSTYTVATVRRMIDSGDEFYTADPDDLTKTAKVKKDDCNIDGCTVATIRSHADATTKNNLDNLAVCP
jgi:hypothetical protein